MEAPLGVNQVPLEPTKGTGSQARPLGASFCRETSIYDIFVLLVGDASGTEIFCIFTLGAEVAFYRYLIVSKVELAS